jgi:predicted glutamine amidotransferase
MFGYCGTLASDVNELYSGLKRACSDDPTLQTIAPGCSRHCHGWGYVIQADNGLFHYRTSRSIYDDDITLPKMEGRIRAIFHGRYASDPNLAGHIFSHPFMTADNRKITFFAHNGGVKADVPLDRKVDSEWAMETFVASADGDPKLAPLTKHTSSALNLLILTIGRAKETPAQLQYFHYFKRDKPSEYYGMFEGAMPGGRALVSSTITLDGAKVKGMSKIVPAVFETITSLES